MDNEKLLTPVEFAKKHGISHVYVYNMIKKPAEDRQKYRGKHEILKSIEVVKVGGKPFIWEKSE